MLKTKHISFIWFFNLVDLHWVHELNGQMILRKNNNRFIFFFFVITNFLQSTLCLFIVISCHVASLCWKLKPFFCFPNDLIMSHFSAYMFFQQDPQYESRQRRKCTVLVLIALSTLIAFTTILIICLVVLNVWGDKSKLIKIQIFRVLLKLCDPQVMVQ